MMASVLDAVLKPLAWSSATALRRFPHARCAVNRRFPWCATRAATKRGVWFLVQPIRAGILWKTPARGWTREDGCRHRQPSAPGDRRIALCDELQCSGAGNTAPTTLRAASSGAFLPGAPKAHPGGVQPHRINGASQRRWRRPAATPCTYGAQASSLARSVPRCEASGLVTTPGPETGYRRNLLVHNVDFGFRLTLNGQHGQVPSGARPLPGHFFAGMSTSIRCALPTGEALDWGAALRAGGTVVFGVL